MTFQTQTPNFTQKIVRGTIETGPDDGFLTSPLYFCPWFLTESRFLHGNACQFSVQAWQISREKMGAPEISDKPRNLSAQGKMGNLFLLMNPIREDG